MATAYQPLSGTPFFMQTKVGSAKAPISYTAAQFRNYTAALSRRTGVLGESAFIVSQTANVSYGVTVNSGYIRVGGDGDNYVVRLGADVNVDLQLAGFDFDPPSPRVHGVYVGVYDGVTNIAGDEYRAQIVICEDVGAGTPVPGGDVAAYSKIATITIKPNHSFIQNSDIDNSQRRHGGSGGEYIAVTLATGFEDNGEVGGTATIRSIYSDGTVRLGGSIRRTNSAVFTSADDYMIGRIHPNLRPTRNRYLTCATSINKTHTDQNTGSYSCRLRIDPDGLMTIAIPAGSSPQYIFFDGVTYDLDGDSLNG